MINDDHELQVTKAAADRFRMSIAELENQCETGNRTILRDAQLAGLNEFLEELEDQIIVYENKKELEENDSRHPDPDIDRGSIPEEREVRQRNDKPVKTGKARPLERI